MNRNSPEYTIKLPVISHKAFELPHSKIDSKLYVEAFRVGLRLVLPISKQSARRAVYQIARLFRREFGYSFVQYAVEGDDPNEVTFVWQRPDIGKGRVFIYGACCFRLKENRRTLQWVWFHPFERRQGHLTRAWPFFRDQFRDFEIAEPISRDMAQFLTKSIADTLTPKNPYPYTGTGRVGE